MKEGKMVIPFLSPKWQNKTKKPQRKPPNCLLYVILRYTGGFAEQNNQKINQFSQQSYS